MNTRIESDVISIQRLFDSSYDIPDYQRGYVWTGIQAEQLISDILYALQDNTSDSEYFIGSAVVCNVKNNVFSVIDGQQRITTLYIIMCVIRDNLLRAGYEIPPFMKSAITTSEQGDNYENIVRYKVELQYKDSRDALFQIADGTADFEAMSISTKSIRNIANAYEFIDRFISEDIKSLNDKSIRLKSIFKYLRENVKIIRIIAQDLEQALIIFETINSRGMSLDAMDLLKNLIFKKAQSKEFDEIKDNWKVMIDNIQDAGEKPLRFLSYFLSAYYVDKPIQEHKLYEWLVKHKDQVGYEKYPLNFSRILKDNALAFKNYLNGNNPSGSENRYLRNLRMSSAKTSRHVIALLPIKDKSEDIILEVCKYMENFIFINTITYSNIRDLDVKYSEWGKKLAKLNKLSDFKNFLEENMVDRTRSLENRFTESFSSADFGKQHKTRLRYILGKLAQYINENAYGSEGSNSNLDSFINKDMHIEHIMPVTPSKDALKEFGETRDVSLYIQKLGNLVLAEKSINTSLGNKSFSIKRTIYPKSVMLLTRAISLDQSVGKSAISKSTQNLTVFREWSPENVDIRTKELIDLAFKVWNLEK